MDASQFLASIDPDYLAVGDGSDARPIWTAVDAAAGKVYRLFASGRVEGFGDGRLVIRNGLGNDEGVSFREAEQVTLGHDCLMRSADRLVSFDLRPAALRASADELGSE